MDIYEIIELLDEAINDKDWDTVQLCKDKLEDIYDLNDGTLDGYYHSED
jgi:hypothetical protein